MIIEIFIIYSRGTLMTATDIPPVLLVSLGSRLVPSGSPDVPLSRSPRVSSGALGVSWVLKWYSGARGRCLYSLAVAHGVYISHRNSSGPPEVFRTCFYNHVHRLRLEKLL